MNAISHNINDETIEAKVRWFRALPLSERMEMLCNFTDLALESISILSDRGRARNQRTLASIVSSLILWDISFILNTYQIFNIFSTYDFAFMVYFSSFFK